MLTFFSIFSRVGCYVSAFSSMSSLQSTFFKEMYTVGFFSGCICNLWLQLPQVADRDLCAFSSLKTSRMWWRSCSSSIQIKCLLWEASSGKNSAHIWMLETKGTSDFLFRLNNFFHLIFQLWLLEETHTVVPQRLENQFLWFPPEL